MLGYLSRGLSSRHITLQSCKFPCISSAERYFSGRYLRTKWERGYLKDLYHRRQLLGADPVLARSSQPNWYAHFPSEICYNALLG